MCLRLLDFAYVEAAAVDLVARGFDSGTPDAAIRG